MQAEFRDVVTRTAITTGTDIELPEIRKQIEGLEQIYMNYLERHRICISAPIPGLAGVALHCGTGAGKNEIPEFRQIVLFDPSLTEKFKRTCVIAVTFDGRLVTGDIWQNLYNPKPATTIQVIEALAGLDQSERKFINGHVNFCLDENVDVIAGSLNINFRYDLSEFKVEAQIEIEDFISRQIHDRLSTIRRAILAALDENVLQDLREYNLMTVSKGSWFTGGDGVKADVVTARQQAVRAYPLLSELFLENHKFRNAIDSRASLSKAIANYFKVNKRMVKRLSGLTWEQVGSVPQPFESVTSLVFDLLHFPERGFPTTARQFQQLDVLRDFGSKIYEEPLAIFAERLSKNGSPWRFIDKMKKADPFNVDDAIQFLALKLLVPAIINRDKRTINNPTIFKRLINMAKKEICNCFKIGELLDWSDRYHRNIARYEDRLDIISIDQDWSGMLGTIDLGDGCIARELTSSRELKEQGRVENHCVGGYVSRILVSMEHSNGQATMIFSLEQDDRILGTAEITCFREDAILDEFGQMGKDHLRAHVKQNLAYNNADPCPMAEKLAEQVVVRLQQVGVDSFRTYLDNLNEVCEEQKRVSGLLYQNIQCKFDPLDRTHLEIVWGELGESLPKRFRDNGLDALIRYGLSQATCQTSSPEM